MRSAEALRQARSDLVAVIEEIRGISDFRRFLKTPTIAEIADAATDPLVYLTAARPGGVALLVRRQQVVAVDLPRLTSGSLVARVQRHLRQYAAYRADPGGHRVAWNAELDRTTGWLWTDVMGPLLAHVEGEERVWIVPGGLLGLLPLHAAWHSVGPSGREYALDRLEINYAPSGQALLPARKAASRAAPHRMLAVAPASGLVTSDRLPLAEPEALCARQALPDGPPPQSGLSADALLRGMAAADVVHLACHGLADLASPLDSRIVLGPDEEVRLRDLMALDLDVRLVVLSACETLLPGTDLPDEVLALPSGLLQAGASAVVASSWVVPDLASAVLMVEFYRRWRSAPQSSPAAALRAAQQWVRDTPLDAKLALYDAAVSGVEDWPDPAVADALIDGLLTDAAPDAFDLIGWAAFAYVGA